jgi:hypothetical protein
MPSSESSPLRLFVVGESSGDPDDWSDVGNRGFALAHSKEEAESMIDEAGCAEVECKEPTVLAIVYRPGI